MIGNVTSLWRQIFRAASSRFKSQPPSAGWVQLELGDHGSHTNVSSEPRAYATPAALASRQQTPIRPMTSAVTLMNIGKESASKVSEQAAPANPAPSERGAQEAQVGVRAAAPGDQRRDRGEQEEDAAGRRSPTVPKLDRREQELVVEVEQRVVGDVGAAALAEPRRGLPERRGMRVVVDPVDDRGVVRPRREQRRERADQAVRGHERRRDGERDGEQGAEAWQRRHQDDHDGEPDHDTR